jgi:hypothetical protein
VRCHSHSALLVNGGYALVHAQAGWDQRFDGEGQQVPVGGADLNSYDHLGPPPLPHHQIAR